MQAKIERNNQILKLRDEGKSFDILADMFKISRPTVMEIYYRDKFKQKKNKVKPIQFVVNKYKFMARRSYPQGEGK